MSSSDAVDMLLKQLQIVTKTIYNEVKLFQE